jgi:hypothetical protein
MLPNSEWRRRFVWFVRMRLARSLKFGLLRLSVQVDGSSMSGVAMFAAVAVNVVISYC